MGRQTCLFSVCAFNGPLEIFRRRVTFHNFVGIIYLGIEELGIIGTFFSRGTEITCEKREGFERVGCSSARVCTYKSQICIFTWHEVSTQLPLNIRQSILYLHSLWLSFTILDEFCLFIWRFRSDGSNTFIALSSAWHFYALNISINSFTPFNNLIIIPFSSWGKWGTERLSNLPEVVELESGGAQSRSRCAHFP